MRISDWSSDVCSSDLFEPADQHRDDQHPLAERADARDAGDHAVESGAGIVDRAGDRRQRGQRIEAGADHDAGQQNGGTDIDREETTERIHDRIRSEEHTSELQSLMRISYAVFCLKKKQTRQPNPTKST